MQWRKIRDKQPPTITEIYGHLYECKIDISYDPLSARLLLTMGNYLYIK